MRAELLGLDTMPSQLGPSGPRLDGARPPHLAATVTAPATGPRSLSRNLRQVQFSTFPQQFCEGVERTVEAESAQVQGKGHLSTTMAGRVAFDPARASLGTQRLLLDRDEDCLGRVLAACSGVTSHGIVSGLPATLRGRRETHGCTSRARDRVGAISPHGPRPSELNDRPDYSA